MDITTIGLKIDSEGVLVATDRLNAFTEAAIKAEAAAASVGSQAADTSAKVKGMGGSAEKATGSADKLSEAQRRAAKVLKDYGLSAGQQKAAFAQLPAQITDIVTSLISGQPAYLVAIQQGGQLKDSFGGIVPAARALIGVISPLAVGLGAASAVIGVMIYGINQGQKEFENFTRTIVTNGGAAGVTAGQLELMAEALDRIGGTRAQAVEALSAIAATGSVGADNLQKFGQTADDAQRFLGVSVSEIAKNFAALGKDPVQTSIKLNESLNYLNATTLEQIRNLKEAGKTTEAAQFAQTAYSNAVNGQSIKVAESIGGISNAWRYVAENAIKAKDAAVSYFATQSDDSRLAQLQSIRGSRALGVVSGERGPRAQQVINDAEERQLQSRLDLLKAGSEYEKQIGERRREGFAAQEANLRVSQGLLTKQEQLNKAVTDYNANLEKQRKAGLTVDPAKAAQDLQRIRDSFASKSGVTPKLETDDSVRDAVQALADFNQRLQDQIATFGMSEEAALAYRLSLGDLSGEVARAGPLGLEYARSIAEHTAKLIDAKEAQDAFNRSVANQRALANDRSDAGRALADIGVGPKQRRFNQGLASRLQDPANLNPGAPDYDRQLAGLKEYNKTALAQYTENFNAVEAKADDFGLQLNESFLAYAESFSKVGLELGASLVGAIQQATDATAELAAQTLLWGGDGVEAAKAIARSLITETATAFIKAGIESAAFYALQKAEIISTAALSRAATTSNTATSVASSGAIATAAAPAAALTTLSTAGSNAIPAAIGIALVSGAIGALLGGAFEKGGSPPVGKISLVGEKGPELFIPQGAGTIIPAAQTAAMLSGGGSALALPGGSLEVNYNVTNRFADARFTPGDVRREADGSLTIEGVIDQINDPGSRMSQTLARRMGVRSQGSIG